MDTLDKSSRTEGKEKLMIELFLEDFERQNWELNYKTKESIFKLKHNLYLLYAFDLIICHVLIGPSVVAFWRGTWDFSNYWYDQLLFGGDHTLSNIVAIVLGLGLNLALDMFHHTVKELAGEVGTWRHLLVRHVYSLTYGVMDIMMWKGVWDGYDEWAGHGAWQAVTSLTAGVGGLSLARTVKTAWSMPNGIVVDRAEEQIHTDTFWQTGPGDKYTRRWTDCLLSRGLELATIAAWHGVWSLADLWAAQQICQDHFYGCLESVVLSLVTGWTGGLLVFLAQFPLLHLSQHRHKTSLNLTVFNVLNYMFSIAGVFFTINSFRAAWYLMDLYYLPSNEILSWISALLLGLLVLTSCRCLSCLHAGVYRDKAGCGVTVPYHLTSLAYIQHHEMSTRGQECSENNNKVPDP